MLQSYSICSWAFLVVQSCATLSCCCCLDPILRKLNNSWMAADLSHLLSVDKIKHKFYCQGKLCKWERSYRAVVAKAEGWFNNTIILLSSALVWHEITMTEWTNEWMKNLPDIYIDNSALWHQLQERCVVDVVRQVGHVNLCRFRLKKNQHKYGKYPLMSSGINLVRQSCLT